MIIIESGTVVGKLDEESMQLTESTSARLTELIDDWNENGVDIMQAQKSTTTRKGNRALILITWS